MRYLSHCFLPCAVYFIGVPAQPSLLTHRISGVKAIGLAEADMDTEADVDTFVSASAMDTIARVVGKGIRDDMLACVYMLRCDGASSVRQSSLQVGVCGAASCQCCMRTYMWAVF